MNQTQPRTGQPCTCRRGQQRDNCPSCEGTGWRIDFAKIRAEVRARGNAILVQIIKGSEPC